MPACHVLRFVYLCIERLEHLVPGLCCFPTYWRLTPLLSPRDKKGEWVN